MRITDFVILTDLKGEYETLRQNGQGREASVQSLVEQYHDELTIGAEDDGLLFWVGIADAQYALKELSSEVAARGLEALDKLKVAVPEITPGDLQRRRERYAGAPMPERAEVRKPRRFHCKWRIGDTFAYQMSGPEADASGIAGDYVLLRKVDEMENVGRIVPVVTLTHWKEAQLPTNAVEFQRVPILRLCRGRLDSPADAYEYRTEILFTREKQVKDLQLRYLGNFADVPMPANEYYPRRPGLVLMLLPQEIDKELNFYCYKLQNYYNQQ